jgi:hypothetical protein
LTKQGDSELKQGQSGQNDRGQSSGQHEAMGQGTPNNSGKSGIKRSHEEAFPD